MIVTKREAKARWVFEAILLAFRRPRVEVNFVEIPQAALEKDGFKRQQSAISQSVVILESAIVSESALVLESALVVAS